MGCKATKTGVLMKWLVCASIYVLLFGVLNSNKLYLLAFFSYLNFLLWSLFDLQMYKYSHYIFSSGATLSCWFLYARIPEHVQCLMPKAHIYMCMCVFKLFFEITEPTEDKVHVGPG